MKTIWKAALQVCDEQTVLMPKGSKILYAREQNNQPCIWYGCDPGKADENENRVIFIRGTGHPLPKIGNYVGTCMLDNGRLVLHIFDLGVAP